MKMYDIYLIISNEWRVLKMNRKSKRKLKNIILKSITTVFAILFIFCVCCLDSESNIFYIGCIVSLLWLVPFGIANGVILL